MPWTNSILKEYKTDSAKRIITYKDALYEAADLLLEKDERVIVCGEGAQDPAGIYGTTLNLHKKYGSNRVFESPLSEQGMTGIMVGAAMTGLRPIYVHARMDFMLLTFDQLVNHASKYSYIFDGKTNVPLVVRCVIARGWGSGAQHSQNLSSLFAHIPGLKVVYPSNPYDAKGMLIQAVEDNNPVIFTEHRWLYKTSSFVPDGYYKVDYSTPKIVKSGDSLTIITNGYSTYQTLSILNDNKEFENRVELIDLRQLNPLNYEPVFDSVSKTKNALVIDENWNKGSIASDIAANIYDKFYGKLKNKIKRITLPNVPTPTPAVLENEFYISNNEILTAINQILGNFKTKEALEPLLDGGGGQNPTRRSFGLILAFCCHNKNAFVLLIFKIKFTELMYKFFVIGRFVHFFCHRITNGGTNAKRNKTFSN